MTEDLVQWGGWFPLVSIHVYNSHLGLGHFFSELEANLMLTLGNPH